MNAADVKRRLSDPREVARLLGMRVVARQARGLSCACPVGGGDDGSLSLTIGQDGTLRVHCFGGCGVSGDVLSLLAALEGSFQRGLERAAELAGGVVVVGSLEETRRDKPTMRLPAELYAALAERICEEGRLDGRREARAVERYLDGRGLLEQARGDRWAALPSLGRLLDLAREVWEERGSRQGNDELSTRKPGEDNPGPGTIPSGEAPPGGFVFRGPGSVLVAAGLARYRDGKLEPLWGGHRLVIPWRGPNGRIHALQRRHLRGSWTRRDGTEYPRYVAPWGLIWTYGAERLAKATAGTGAVAIVEGAVDALALRALYPRLLVVGLPGLGGWEPSWARLFVGRPVRLALDRGMPGLDGVIVEDRVAARIALDLAGRPEDAERVARAKTSPCVLCGSEAEPWLCRACGRRRPQGKDWGVDWAARVRGG